MKPLPLPMEMAAETTYFTHISHRLGRHEISARLPANIKLAYDGLK
jgi:phosphoribosyl 1,2-cyclic phosphate phosphodiesterase